MDLSVIIPCYNESNKIVKNIYSTISYMQQYHTGLQYEILVVNDGSKDNTKKCIEDEFKGSSIVTLLSYEPNRGKGYAVNYGMSRAHGKTILFMDADLATDLSAIDTVLQEREHYDVIIGSRRDENSTYEQGRLRLFISKCCEIISNCIVPLHVPDTQCGFKAFSAKCAKEILPLQKMNNFVFDVELLYIAELHDYSIKPISVKWKNGCDSRVSIVKSSVRFFRDLFKIRRHKKDYISTTR
jgi:glycosyltransferase involved in cell wall biosynthesis